jgi:hypothetical protein
MRWTTTARLRAGLGGHCIEAVGIAIQVKPFGSLAQDKNPAAPAVKREADEDWGGKREMNSKQSDT